MDQRTSSGTMDAGGSEHHEDDEIGSTIAVHAASPRPNVFSVRSAPDDISDDDYPASDEADVTSLDPRQRAVPGKHTRPVTKNDPDDRNDADDEGEDDKSPAQLSLNKMNLKTFETSAKQGNIPLRTDMLGARQTLPGKKVTASSSLFVNSGVEDGSPLRYGVHTQSPLSRRENSQSLAPLDKMSVASVDCEVGSTVPMRDGDDLNAENLREHMRELYSGQPLPLHAENIGGSRPRRRSPRSDRRDDLSVLVEPSEADAPSVTSSAVLPADPQPQSSLPYRLNVGQSTLQRGDIAVTNGAVEDHWSTASTGERDYSFLSSFGAVSAYGNDGAGVYSNMLSTESLVQLRNQIESGETPLRPEMLYGFIRAMGHGAPPPGVSPSMVVEAPAEDRGQFNASPGPALRTSSSGGGTSHPPLLSDQLANDGETDRAERGSNSPHVPGTDHGDNGDEDDIEEEEADGEVRRARPQGADEDDNSSVAEHNESLLLTDGENYTEDTDLGVTKDQVRELWRAIVELKNERRHFERRFAETSRKLDTMDAHSQELITGTKVAISQKLDTAVQAIESRLATQLQDAIRTLQTVVTGNPGSSNSSGPDASATAPRPPPFSPSGTPPPGDSFASASDVVMVTTSASQSAPPPPPSRTTIRLLMQVSPSLLQNRTASKGNEEKPLDFIVPMACTATVGESKAKLVSRLQQAAVLKSTVSVSTTVLQYNGRHVFDEDQLADVIDSDCAATGNQTAEAHLFVLDGVSVHE